ncbi:hypothetical protein CFC21_054420 [Triticum aestivum]|uniref:Zinc finger-XS domain-containing protein n=4 Tax=Triticum TaxID=4564 RepID=A0A9R0SMQ2_TRITD|nr:hypothetical protein CFC21_054420 [Triticum aestivum]VAH97638.1 unnamed protein product [Triticum turgidum subsp. durum]
MAGGGGPPGSKKRKRVAARRSKVKRAKGKKPYEASAARGGGGGGSKEEPQPVTAMDERVAAEEMSESREPDCNLDKELKVLCVKLRYHNMSTNRRGRLVTEALRKMDGKYLEIARSPTACVLQLCVKWCSHSERDPVFVALQPHLLDLSLNEHTVFLVHNIIKMATRKQFASFIYSLRGHVASLLCHTIGAAVLDHAFCQATRPHKRSLLLELYSTELQLSNDLKEEKPCRFSLLNIISKLGLQKSSVLQHMTTVVQPVLEKGIVEYSIVHTVILEYLTIADKTSALDVIRQLIPHLTQGTYAVDELSGVARFLGKSEVEKKRSSKPLLIQIMQTKEGLKLGLACLKHGLAEDRKRIIKSLKGRIMKLALSDYGCLFVICLLSIVDNTELVTEVVIDVLKKQLKELIFDKNGRHPLLQLFHPLCSRYLTLGELFYLNYNVPSLVSKVNFGSKLDDVADKEHGGSEDTLIASDSKEDPIKRRQELLVKSELYEVLIETCIENVGQLLRTNFGKDVLYEVSVGGKNNFLEGVTDRIHVLHNAIACDAARPRTDDGDEHAFDNYHSSRTIRRMILDCPAFAATLWKTALEGKCKLYADGFSSMVLAAYLESPNSGVKDLAKSELQPLIDGGILKPQDHKAEEKSAMECSSDESSELSDTDTGYHAKKAYKDLKSGKLVARFGTDRFRCPFCPEKKQLDYRYRELIRHVIVVGASRRPWKVRANHRALAKHLETDHADAPGSSSMPLRQAEALYLSKIKRSQAGARSTCKLSR